MKKMSKLSSRYGSRKSVSSIEPTLYNANELYEAGDYDGITIAIENELEKHVDEGLERNYDPEELVTEAYDELYDALIPLIKKSVGDINIP